MLLYQLSSHLLFYILSQILFTVSQIMATIGIAQTSAQLIPPQSIVLYSYLFDYITKHTQLYAPLSGIPPKSTLIHNSPQMTNGLSLITLP